MADHLDSKRAEQQYLGRTGGSAWEREKPFSPPGDDTLAESLELLHDFSVAIQLLQPAVGDLVLDLGAGSGWCSDLLQRLNRRTVAVDISLEMLNVARQRASRAPLTMTAGDFERLPFRDGVFAKAVCLNALHHVPDMPAAVREISRVLTDDGVAVFSEPGRGHAATPESRSAMRDYGVLEQEVLIEPFIRSCHEAGFVDVRICPISYAIPQFQLSLDEWRAWQKLALQKRPFRAGHKVWRALLELFGVGKGSILFEEAFAIRLVRLFQQPVETHPFIVAAKAAGSHAGPAPLRAKIEIVSLSESVHRDQIIVAVVKTLNLGTTTWSAHATASGGPVRVGVQLLDDSGRILAKDFARASLPGNVPAGDGSIIRFEFPAPDNGRYQLKFDMVAEGLTWFEQTGSPVELRSLHVKG